jgi:hypothetical protein
MNQKQSDDFDSVVRRLAEEAESVYQAHSWRLMEELLDKKKKKRGIAWWYWPLGALMLGSLFWIGKPYIASLLSRGNSPYQYAVREVGSGNSLRYAIQFTADQIFKNLPLQGLESDQAENSIANGDQLTMENGKISANNVSADPIEKGNKKPATGSKSTVQSGLASLKSKLLNHTQRNGPDSDLDINVNRLKANQSNTAAKIKVQSTATSPEENINVSPSLSDPIIPANPLPGSERMNLADRTMHVPPLPSMIRYPGNTRKVNLKEWQSNPITPLKKPAHSAIIFGFGYAPEYTAVVKRTAGTLGETYGFHIGYRLHRWAFTAGLQKSAKDYNALKEDYEIPVSSYYKNLKVFNIKGDCNVLQLPVNVHFTLFDTKLFALRLNAGVSSLRMDKEVYIIDYLHANWKPGHDQYSYTTKNWNWLAAASAGVSIQKSITRHLGISIDPYYQLPLKGVGDGNVNLKSFGSQVGVFWSIPTNK